MSPRHTKSHIATTHGGKIGWNEYMDILYNIILLRRVSGRPDYSDFTEPPVPTASHISRSLFSCRLNSATRTCGPSGSLVVKRIEWHIALSIGYG